jgi:hypothetical protein
MISVSFFCSGQRRLGLVRDIGDGGMYLYSDFAPAIGQRIDVTLSSGFGSAARSTSFSGTVIRVLSPCAGAATGIAIKTASGDPAVSISQFVLSRTKS